MSGNAATISDTVRSFFNNYTYYKWQRSTDGGLSWIDVTLPTGPVVPIWNGTAWQYVSTYTIPPAFTTLANNGNKYRLIVATSLTNLADLNCRSTDPSTIVTLNIINCGPPLSTKITAFSGKITSSKPILKWTTNIESEPLYFDIEKSTDGSNFITIGTVNSHNDPGAAQNNYLFADPEDVAGTVYYRISMRTQDGEITYSRIIQLSVNPESFSFVSVINPFVSALYFDIASTKDGIVKADLIDQFGKPVKRGTFDIRAGVTQLAFDNTGALAAGIYILRVEMEGTAIYKRVMKQNR